MTAATPDFPDFATPVAVLDQSAHFTSGPTNANGITVGPFDVSRVNTLFVRVQCPSAVTPAGKRYCASVAWRESGNPVYQEGFTFHSTASYFDNLDEFYWTLPVRGQTFELDVNGDTAANVLCDVVGSTRQPPPAPRLANNRSPFSRDIESIAMAAIAAGGTSPTVYIPPVGDSVMIQTNIHQTYMRWQLLGVVFEAAVMKAHTILDTDSTADVFNGIPFHVPNIGLELSVTNNDAAVHAPVLNVWDVS